MSGSIMRLFSLIVLAALAWSYAAVAQSNPNPPFSYGSIPTAGQWNGYFASKQDYLGFTPFSTNGGSLNGELLTLPSSALLSGLNIGVGVAPTVPIPGDVWMTTSGLYYRSSSTTYGPIVGTSGIRTLESFGSVPYNGSTPVDNTVAIQSACNWSASSVPNGIVLVDAVFYTQTIVVSGGTCHIVGSDYNLDQIRFMPNNVTSSVSTASGSIPAGTYQVIVYALDGSSNVINVAPLSTPAVLSATGQITVTWPAITGAVSYNVYVQPYLHGYVPASLTNVAVGVTSPLTLTSLPASGATAPAWENPIFQIAFGTSPGFLKIEHVGLNGQGRASDDVHFDDYALGGGCPYTESYYGNDVQFYGGVLDQLYIGQCRYLAQSYGFSKYYSGQNAIVFNGVADARFYDFDASLAGGYGVKLIAPGTNTFIGAHVFNNGNGIYSDNNGHRNKWIAAYIDNNQGLGADIEGEQDELIGPRFTGNCLSGSSGCEDLLLNYGPVSVVDPTFVQTTNAGPPPFPAYSIFFGTNIIGANISPIMPMTASAFYATAFTNMFQYINVPPAQLAPSGSGNLGFIPFAPGNTIDVSKYSGTVAQAVATGLPLYFPSGSYTLTGTPTISQSLWFAPGATLSCTTPSIAGNITASRAQIFASGCTPSFFSNTTLADAPVEWWGAVANSNGTTGNGADNHTPFVNAFASGAPLSLSKGSYRMTPIITSTRSNFSLKGISRDLSKIFIDDTAGVNDGIFFSNGSGDLLITDIGIYRIQGTTGSVSGAYPIAQGAGYNVGDTITLSGGTFTTACQVTVATVSSGAITSVTVTTAGSYTAGPITAATQSATSGGGSGATLWLTMTGPADLHIEDNFRTEIMRTAFGAVSKTWDAIRLDSASANTNKITVENSIFNGAQNDAIIMVGTTAKQLADVFVNNNYIYNSSRSGIELYGNISGVSIQNNNEYSTPYAVIASSGAFAGQTVNVLKVQNNYEDTNSQGSYWHGVAASLYENNWHSSGGRWTCEDCADIQASGNLYVGASSGVSLLGSFGINLDGSQFSLMTNAITFGTYGTNDNSAISAVSNSFISSPGAPGHFLDTITGSPSKISASANTDGTSTFALGAFTSLMNLGFLGTTPTLTTGSCSGSAWVGNSKDGQFTAPLCAAGTFILSGLPLAAHGYTCSAQDQTTPADTLKQTANTTSSCTLTSTTAASDIIPVQATGW